MQQKGVFFLLIVTATLVNRTRPHSKKNGFHYKRGINQDLPYICAYKFRANIKQIVEVLVSIMFNLFYLQRLWFLVRVLASSVIATNHLPVHKLLSTAKVSNCRI